MDRYIKINPNLKEKAERLIRIQKRTAFKDIQDLDSRLCVFKLPLAKKLMENGFYGSPQLKEAYEQISKAETNKAEKILFDVLNNRNVCFDEYELYILFCKHFPAQIYLFQIDKEFELEDLMFRKVYLKVKDIEEIQESIIALPFKQQILAFIAMSSFLDTKFTKGQLMKMKNNYEILKKKENLTEVDFIHNWILGIRCLESKEYYGLLASEFIYSTYTHKVNVYRACDGCTDFEKLCSFMLNVCFTNTMSLVQNYVNFLKVIELFSISYSFKLKLLYCWLRFFITQNYFDLFFDLTARLKKSQKLDTEFSIYIAIEDYLQKSINVNELQNKMNEYKEENTVSEIKIDEILVSLLKKSS